MIYYNYLEKESDTELIWAENFQQVLRKRHEERVETATKRVNDLTAEAIRDVVEGAQNDDAQIQEEEEK